MEVLTAGDEALEDVLSRPTSGLSSGRLHRPLMCSNSWIWAQQIRAPTLKLTLFQLIAHMRRTPGTPSQILSGTHCECQAGFDKSCRKADRRRFGGKTQLSVGEFFRLVEPLSRRHAYISQEKTFCLCSTKLNEIRPFLLSYLSAVFMLAGLAPTCIGKMPPGVSIHKLARV